VKVTRLLIKWLALCSSLGIIGLFLLPVFASSASAQGAIFRFGTPSPAASPTPTPTGHVVTPDCLRHPAISPFAIHQFSLQSSVEESQEKQTTASYYATVLAVSGSVDGIAYQITIPVGLLPGMQTSATLIVSTELQNSQLAGKVLVPGTRLSVTATLADTKTFVASDVHVTDALTYYACRNFSAFTNTPPYTIFGSQIVYWQVANQYTLVFDQNLFPVNLNKPFVATVYFQNGQAVVQSVKNT
jgi:hypothetical protein